MSQTAENAIWRIKKRPIIDGYLSAHKQAENQVAGQGFLYRPGFLAEAATAIEREAKFKLSEINYQIVQQMIERELAQTGHEYDILVKEAMIAWELEKAQTLTELEQDFADNKYLRELDKEELKRKLIALDVYKILIIQLKAQAEIDMEELKRRFFDVERDIVPYETALLNAKLVTAKKKLEVIPYIEEVIAKQQLIIDAETNNADRKNALITAKEGLNDKREELIDARSEIAGKIVLLIAARQALVEKKQDLVDAREEIATVELQNATYLQQYISALTGLDTQLWDLITAKNLLIPKLTEKSLALIAYAAQIDAWIVVKQAIAVIKEQTADAEMDKVGQRINVVYAKIALNNLELALKEARLDLEVARMTGHSDLLTEQIGNATELLNQKQEALTAEIDRQSELTSAQLEYDLHAITTDLETRKQVETIGLEAGLVEISKITSAAIHEREGTAAAAVNTNITSKLVHLLS